jgi:hypothetical protein
MTRRWRLPGKGVAFHERGLPLAAWFFCAFVPSSVVAQQAAIEETRDSVPQRDLMDLLSRVLHGKPNFGDTVEIPPKMILTILPSFAANPTVGVSLGVPGNAVTRLGNDETTHLSTISASVSYTTKKQFNILLRSNVFTSGNTWKLEGDWRYLDTNQPTFGLGPAFPEELKTEMDFNLLRFYETVYREVIPDVLLGVGYHFNHYFTIIDHSPDPTTSAFGRYYGGQPVSKSTASGASLNILGDTRDNPINAKRGHYARASYRIFPTWMGSDDSWQSLETEFRAYPQTSLPGHGILAFWGLTWFSFGAPPYLELPAIGWDYNNRSGRGYAQGRIRAGDLVYGEAEYRVTLTRDGLWGAAAFFNLTSASDDTGTLQSPDPGGGFGIRLKLNKHSDTNIAIDVGFGAQGSGGVFFGTGEAF